MQRKAPVRLTSTTRLPLLDRQLLERDRRRAGAGVVEQQVEAAERRLGRREQRLDRGRVGDVGRDGESAVGAARRPPRALPRSASARRPARATWQPAFSRARAVARPMPLPAPVTMATFFMASSPGGIGGGGILAGAAPSASAAAKQPANGEPEARVEHGREDQRQRRRDEREALRPNRPTPMLTSQQRSSQSAEPAEAVDGERALVAPDRHGAEEERLGPALRAPETSAGACQNGIESSAQRTRGAAAGRAAGAGRRACAAADSGVVLASGSDGQEASRARRRRARRRARRRRQVAAT